jgi:hypothetical protein
MFDKVERTSPAYRRMVDHHSHNTRKDGFPYLNSDRCIKAWTDIRSEALDTLDYINQPRLREIFDLWNRQNELRDKEMAKNISDYAVRSGFVHAVFLFGAAHMQSIIENVETGSPTSIPRIEWEVDIPLRGGA